MKKIVLLAILILMSGCVSVQQGVKRQRATPAEINLARTSIACVTASSVNGNRELGNIFYGIVNAFDDGENWHKGINYTYWLSSPGDLQPHIEVCFDVPVTVSAVVVENGPAFSSMFVDVSGRERHCGPVNSVLPLQEIVVDVKKVRLTFTKGIVRVDEVRIMGNAPGAGVLEMCRPRIKEKESQPQQTVKRLAEELSQRLGAFGAFQANYKALSPDKAAADITILFNGDRKYCLAKFVMENSDKPDFCLVLDFSEMDGENPGFHILMLKRDGGKKFTMYFRDLLRLDNPFGIIFFMVKQFESETGNDFLEFDIRSAVPSLSLGLSEKKLVLGMGVRSKGNAISVSWLDTEELKNAIEVVESSDSIEFRFAGNHVISVDRKTGLLLKDSWPDLAREGLREILLKNHAVLDPNLPYTSYIPSFSNIKIDELPPTHLYEEITTVFLTNVGRQLGTIDNFDEVLKEHSSQIASVAKKAGRQMVRENMTRVEIEKATESIKSAYEQFLEKCPQKMKELTFVQFLEKLVTVENKSDINVSSRKLDSFNSLKKESEATIPKLPKDVQEPLKKLCDIAIPALAEGCVSEFFQTILRQAKSIETNTGNR